MSFRLVSLPVAAVVWTSVALAAQAAGPFADVPEQHWAADDVRFAAVEHDFMRAMPDGTFHGDAPFTRVQLAVAMRALLDDLENVSHTSWKSPGVGGYRFSDIRDARTREVAVALADDYHLFEGLPGVSAAALGGDQVVTRYEMAKVVDRMCKLGEAKGVMDPTMLTPRNRIFSDLPTSAWDYGDVKEVSDRYQVMIGFPDGTFRGRDELTRYQFAAAARQTFPLAHSLVSKTVERTASPTPAPATGPVHRFQEDMPLHVGLAGRLDSNVGLYGSARWVGYAGPIFGLARVRAGLPLASGSRLYDGNLDVGYAWTLTPTFALEPFIGGAMAMTGSAMLGSASYGAIASWNPSPFSLWVGGLGNSPLGANVGNPQGLFLWDATGGIGWAFTPRFGINLEVGYGTVPLAPAAGATTYGTEQALTGEAGLSFGF